jgi:hypothetical protein
MTHLAVAYITFSGITSGVTLCGWTFREAFEGSSPRGKLCPKCITGFRQHSEAYGELPMADRLESEYRALIRDMFLALADEREALRFTLANERGLRKVNSNPAIVNSRRAMPPRP